MSRFLLFTLVSTVIVAACHAADGERADGSAGSASGRTSFDGTAPGALPAGWTPAETSGAGHPGSWRVVESGDEARGRIVRLADVANEGATFNLLLGPRSAGADVVVSALVRAETGEEDQGGGVLWRAQGPDDYYVARWNPLEQNLRLYRVIGGERTLLRSADVAADPFAWHSIAAAMRGTAMRVSFDGRALLEAEDASLAAPGRIGLWTKADAGTAFDDVVLE
jgi:hypothetical protein